MPAPIRSQPAAARTLVTCLLVPGLLLAVAAPTAAGQQPAAGEEAVTGVPDLRIVGWEINDSTGGNGDGGLHPGETGSLIISLANFGSEAARNVAGTLTELIDHPDITIVDKFATWQDIPAASGAWATDVPYFRVQVAGTRPCAWEIPLELEVTALGGYTTTLSLVVELRDRPVVDLWRGSGRPAIYGIDSNDFLGTRPVTGDLDGDGFDEIIASAPNADGPGNVGTDRGEAVIVYGGPARRADLQMAEPPPADTGIIYGADDADFLAALAVGDIDGDGFDDLVMGSSVSEGSGNALADAGEVAIVYGSATRISTLDLSAPPAGVSFIYGAQAGDNLGNAVATGDLNDDGYDDLILAAFGANGPGGLRASAGSIVVIPGGPVRLPNIVLSAPPPYVTTIHGAETLDRVGSQVSAGDVDGDGFQDVLAAAYLADGPGNSRSGAGEGYVIYGAPSFPAEIDLLAPAVPVTVIYGVDENDNLGHFVVLQRSLASGDLDGDGFDEVVLGAGVADGAGNGVLNAGEVAIVYGQASRPAVVDLAVRSDHVRFVRGAANGDRAGESVHVTDLDGDGLNELIVAVPNAENPSLSLFSHGNIFIIPGRAQRRPDLDLFVPQPDVTRILGRSPSDEIRQVGSGDMDGDGLQDLLIGIPNGDGSAAVPSAQNGEILVLPGSPRSAYRHDEDTFAFINGTLGTDLGLACDDCSATIPIGFDFDFFGVKHDQVTVSSNGYLTFGGPGDLPAGFCTPTSNVPNDLIAVFWDDLDPSAGGTVHALAEGVEPNRRLTVQWTSVPLFGGIGDATFQVTLFESSDQILMQYQDVIFGDAADNGGTAVVGVESASGLRGTARSCFSPGVDDASAVRWRRFARPTRVFYEDVDTGGATWTATGLWHTVLDPTCAPSMRSRTRSFYYGQDAGCTFDTGARTGGDLTSPVITGLPQDAALSFWHRRQTEGTGLDFDRSSVFIQAGGGGFFELMRFSENSNSWRFTDDFLPPSAQAGQLVTLPLLTLAGSDVEIRFTFDSIDSTANGFLGWMIDDIAIDACPVFNTASMTTDGVGVQAVATASPATLCETQAGSVDAAGSYCTACPGGLTYQWRQGGVPIPGATGAAHAVPASPPGMTSYSVAIACPANPSCAATSAPATVTSVAQPEGVGATLTVEMPGTELEFHWTDIGGADDYGLFSSLTADGTFATLAGVAGSGTTGITIPAPADPLVYYLVAGRNAVCGAGPKNNFRTP